DAGTGCLACCCPCIVFGQNMERVKRIQNNGQNSPDACGIHCLLYSAAMCFGLPFIAGCYGRDQLRKATNTADDYVQDFVCHLCCSPCALAQEKIELDSLGK
ncbi:hypothetical protein BC831DRAFT_396111, partial [Entophlyctis helioformis]